MSANNTRGMMHKLTYVLQQMSKKWTNPPLNLRPATASSQDSQEPQIRQDPPSTIEVVPPESISTSFRSHRDSTLSDAQYAFASTNNQYLDLPSAVPFQDFVSPALPSAEFPSSARDFVSPPGTSSTTTGFPDPSSSSFHQTVAVHHPYKDGNKHQSNPTAHSDHHPAPSTGHPIVIPPTSGATALSRADSSVSYDSVWSGEGSQQHIALDITQFPRPPGTASDEPSSTRSSPSVPSFNPSRKSTRLKPPVSPLYEESEPSSRPLTPNAGEVSYQYPVSSSSQQQSTSSLAQTQDTPDADSLIIQYLRPHSDLILPSLAPTSPRASYQSHLTAASRGSSSPRLSIGDVPARASAGPSPSMTWANVMSSKQGWNTSEPVRHDSSMPRSPVMSTISTNAAVGTSTVGNDDGVSIHAPPVPAGSLLSPFSGGSSPDVYSAIGRMSFPKPPILPATGNEEPSSPLSPGPPKSPWVTGLTLKTKTSRGSIATVKRRADDTMSPPLSPTAPPLPNTNPAASSFPPLILSSPDEEMTNLSGIQESNRDNQRLDVPVESRHSAQSGQSS